MERLMILMEMIRVRETNSDVEQRAKLDQRIGGIHITKQYDTDGNFIGIKRVVNQPRKRNVWKCKIWDRCLSRDNCAVAMGDYQACGEDDPDMLAYLDEIDPIDDGVDLMENIVLIRCRACGRDLTNEEEITWYYCPESERFGNEVDECSPFCVVCPEKEPTEKQKQFIKEVKELIDENTDIEVELSRL